MNVASIILAVALSDIPTSAHAQSSQYKLITAWYQSNLTVIDYPSKDRCEAAARAVNAETARWLAESDALAPPGSIRISNGANTAFCIPG